MSEWRPIETLPAVESDEDPTTVLLWVADGGNDGSGVMAFGCAYKGRRTNARKVRAFHYSGDWDITHWMPLPEPPA